MPAALSVQNGRTGTVAYRRAANSASAFWPLKKEKKTPADHLRTPALSTLGPFPTCIVLPAASLTQPPHGGGGGGSGRGRGRGGGGGGNRMEQR